MSTEGRSRRFAKSKRYGINFVALPWWCAKGNAPFLFFNKSEERGNPLSKKKQETPPAPAARVELHGCLGEWLRAHPTTYVVAAVSDCKGRVLVSKEGSNLLLPSSRCLYLDTLAAKLGSLLVSWGVSLLGRPGQIILLNEDGQRDEPAYVIIPAVVQGQGNGVWLKPEEALEAEAALPPFVAVAMRAALAQKTTLSLREAA